VTVTDKNLVLRHFVPLYAVRLSVPNPFNVLPEHDLLPPQTETARTGTSQELRDGIIMENYSDLKPRMFRVEEFEKIKPAGIIGPAQKAQLIAGGVGLVTDWNAWTGKAVGPIRSVLFAHRVCA
jgi:hypothetical protein